MQKIIFSVLFTAFFLALTAPAQTSPVQITGGRLLIPARMSTSGSAELISEIFSSTGFITGVVYTNWYGICDLPDCRPGATFSTPDIFYISDLQRTGNFTINGVTYNGAYYSGIFNLGQHTFRIPQIVRKKGLMSFSRPFTMSGRLYVCQVNDYSSCPADKVLFDRDVIGHGTSTAIMRIKILDVFGNGRPITYLQPESFEFRFEP